MPQRRDDTSISDDEVLWRRILADYRWTTTKGGALRPSSVAFIDHRSGGLSVYIGCETTKENVLAGHPGDGIASVTAGQIRALGAFVIIRDAIPLHEDPAGDAHAVVRPTPERSAASALARNATWVHTPSSAPIDPD